MQEAVVGMLEQAGLVQWGVAAMKDATVFAHCDGCDRFSPLFLGLVGCRWWTNTLWRHLKPLAMAWPCISVPRAPDRVELVSLTSFTVSPEA